MTNFGVSIAIIQDGRILLAEREDFEVWALPGGLIDPGESIAQAALREAGEETGLKVELTRLRDDSGLSRSEFYRYYFKKPEAGPPIQELGASLAGGHE